MKVLLDTHIALWALTNSPRLPPRARALISDEAVDVYFSSISISEISVKHAIHPQEMPVSGAEALSAFRAAGYTELAYSASSAAALDLLPLHHRDPFDRMLLAQAKDAEMFIVSHDNRFCAYGEFVIGV